MFKKFEYMNKIVNVVFGLLLVFVPAMGQVQQNLSLDGEWKFAVDSTQIGFKSNWQNGIAATTVRKVKVPHTWNIEKGSEEYSGWAWYEREIEIPTDWKDKSLRLKFAAVYHDAIVYINGIKVGENLNAGYTPFSIDISKSVVFGRTNKLVVAVNNQFSANNLPYKDSFDWCNDGGIIRSVKLEVTGKPSIRFVHLKPQFNASEGTGSATVAVKLWESNVDRVTLSYTFRDKTTGQIVLSETKNFHSDNGIFSVDFQFGKVKPWHFDSPDLYELETSVVTKNGPSDVEKSVFGFKDIKIVGENLYLNVELVRLPGIEYMPGSSPKYGIAEPQSYMDSVARFMKELNVCITRFHWPQDDYMLSLMDKYGILVQEELPWWQKPARLTPELVNSAEKQLGSLIESHYNHPSIFSWGISNEVNGDTQKETYLQLKNFVRNLDPTRLVTVVSNRIWQKKERDESLLFDLPTWNEYIGTWHGKNRNELPGKLDTVKMTIGDRPLLITENGLCEPAITGGDARRIDDMLFHINQWQKQPFTIGYIYFCLNDYRTQMGEEGAGKYKIRRHGVTDVNLNPKPSYSVLKQIASPIDITKVERVNNSTAKIEIKVKQSIPTYTLVGYKLKYTDNKNEQVEVKLPPLKPGEVFTTELVNINPQFLFEILRPGDFSVVEY